MRRQPNKPFGTLDNLWHRLFSQLKGIFLLLIGRHRHTRMSDGEITATLICPADMDRLILMFLSQQVLSLNGIIGCPKRHRRGRNVYERSSSSFGSLKSFVSDHH